MRIIRFLIYYAMVTALGLLALLFLALNHFTVELDLIEARYSVSVAWVIVGAVAFGFLIAFLVLLPGRIAAGLYGRALARDVRALNDDVRDLEYALDEQEDLRGRLLAQHEILLERHEHMLMRHQTLVSDHSQVVAERNDARAQLASLRIARPAASLGSGAATALRLLPQAQTSSPAPGQAPAQVALPSAPQPAAAPVARVAPPAPAQQPVTPITPGPWPGVADVADVADAAPDAPVPAVAPAPAPEPTTVPVVSAPPAPVAPTAPAPAPAPVAPRVKRPGVVARLRSSAQRSWQTTATRFAHLRQRLKRRSGEAWRALATTASAQSKAQRTRLRALQQRIAAIRNDAE